MHDRHAEAAVTRLSVRQKPMRLGVVLVLAGAAPNNQQRLVRTEL